MVIFSDFSGDLFILVIIKVMQYNMAHTKDRYLHTNCLAMLANMSSKFIHLQVPTFLVGSDINWTTLKWFTVESPAKVAPK